MDRLIALATSFQVDRSSYFVSAMLASQCGTAAVGVPIGVDIDGDGTADINIDAASFPGHMYYQGQVELLIMHCRIVQF